MLQVFHGHTCICRCLGLFLGICTDLWFMLLRFRYCSLLGWFAVRILSKCCLRFLGTCFHLVLKDQLHDLNRFRTQKLRILPLVPNWSWCKPCTLLLLTLFRNLLLSLLLSTIDCLCTQLETYRSYSHLDLLFVQSSFLPLILNSLGQMFLHITGLIMMQWTWF